MSTIIIKNSNVPGKIPQLSDLVYGELALNYADGKLFFKTVSNTINQFSIGSVTSVNVSGGTTGFDFTGGPITSSGTITLSGILSAANGGTGRSSITSGQVVFGAGTSQVGISSNFTFDGTSLLSVGPTATGLQLDGSLSSIKSTGTNSDINLVPNGSGKVVLGNLVDITLRSASSRKLTLLSDNELILQSSSKITAQLPVDSTNKISISGPSAIQYSTNLTDNDVTNKKYVDLTVASLIPSQTGNQNKFLTTNGFGLLSWVAATGTGTVTSVALSGGTTGLTVTGSPVTTAGTITLSGTLGIANGGTGATTQQGAANSVLPSQSSNAGKYLSTDGTNVTWAGAAVTFGQLQYNNAGIVSGSNRITYNGTDTLTVGIGGSVNQAFKIIGNNVTASGISIIGGSTNGVQSEIAGGEILIEGGAASQLSDGGGQVTIKGGSGTGPLGNSSGAGGNVVIQAGDGGSNDSTANGGNVYIEAGQSGNSGGVGGSIIFSTGDVVAERARILSNGAWSVGTDGVSTGALGQVLTSNGANASPSWQSIPVSNSTYINGNNTTNSTFYPTFVASNSTGNQIVNTSGALAYNPSTESLSSSSFSVSNGNLGSASFTTTTADPNQVIDQVSTSAYRTVKYLIQVTTGAFYQATELLVIHDGTTAYLTEYGTITTNTILATFDVSILAGNMRLLATPVNSNNIIKVVRTAVSI